MGEVATNDDIKDVDAIPLSQKGAANGVATLGADSKVPLVQLPSMPYIPTTQKAAANGVASLGADTKVPNEQLPTVTLIGKGDIITFDGADATRLPVGTNGQVLTADNAAPDGIAWKTPSTSLVTDGSIFSMKGPLGAADALVSYDFTRFNPALSLAQNLSASNQSLVFAYDLLATNNPVYDYAAKSSLSGPRPKNALAQGGALLTTDTVPDYVTTNLLTNNGLRLIGAMTAECLVTILAISNTNGQEGVLLAMSAPGETEDTNQLYVMRIAVSTGPIYTLAYFAEHNAGVNITANLCTIPSPVGAGPIYFALTRDATGKVTAYINGARVSALITPTDEGGGGVILPTRGANPTQNLRLGGTTAQGFKALWHAVKISSECFTDAQIQESYNRSIYGIGSTLV